MLGSVPSPDVNSAPTEVGSGAGSLLDRRVQYKSRHLLGDRSTHCCPVFCPRLETPAMGIRLVPRRSACIHVILVLFAAPVTYGVRARVFRSVKKLALLPFLLHLTLHAFEAAGQDSQSPYTERIRKEF